MPVVTRNSLRNRYGDDNMEINQNNNKFKIMETAAGGHGGKNPKKRPALTDLSNHDATRLRISKNEKKSKATIKENSAPQQQEENLKKRSKLRRTRKSKEDEQQQDNNTAEKMKPKTLNYDFGYHTLPLPDDVEDVDLRHMDDPTYCRTYVKDIYSYLRNLQSKYTSWYGSEDSYGITPYMRRILVDWLVEVADEYMLMSDTLYLCISYIDRCIPRLKISRKKFQLFGCACMLIAAKYEEMYAPAVEEFVIISDNAFTQAELLEMEGKVLTALDFKLIASTPKPFLRRFQRAAHVRSREKNLCNYLAELSLLDVTANVYEPSKIAASALFLARAQLFHHDEPSIDQVWTKTIAHYTGYKPNELHQCIHFLLKLQNDVPQSDYASIHEKYSSKAYDMVAKLPSVPNVDIFLH